MSSVFDSAVWEHKYRPRKIDDTILPPETKKMIKEIVAAGDIQPMLFSGTAGIGKTTLAYAISKELDADILFVNASLEGNIDTIRTKITQFVTSASLTDSPKVVLLDECDYLSDKAQPALRGFLDGFSGSAIFILTCNYKNRLVDPLLSRLTEVNFKFTKAEAADAAKQMLARCCYILDSENVKYDRKAVAGLVAKNFPDFRRTVVELQRYSSSGTIDSGILATIDEGGINELSDFIKNKEFSKARTWVANNQMDSSAFYRMFYDKVSKKLLTQHVPQLILLIAEYQFRAAMDIDQEINQVAFIVEVMKSCQFAGDA